MDRNSLDRYITGNYGEDQLKGEAEFEKELERLFRLRAKSLHARSGFNVMKAEALLDKHCPDWREYDTTLPCGHDESDMRSTNPECKSITSYCSKCAAENE